MLLRTLSIFENIAIFDAPTVVYFKPFMSFRAGILLLYFFSGFSALVYEIVWARMLGLIIGTTVAAWGAVLAASMGGMALGAATGGRFVDRTERPLRFFALCEAGIGLFGAASPALLHFAQTLFIAAQPFLGTTWTAQTLTRVMPAIILLAVPTMLMGATFPAISRAFFAKERQFGRDLGALYSVNTLGAVAGTLATGFVLLPVLGMSSSLFLAAAINGSVAGAGLLAARRHSADSPAGDACAETGTTPASPAPPAWLLPAVLACSGFCAMAFEVLWSRGLVFFLSSTTYAFTTVLSVVLAGLAVGSAAATAIGRIPDPRRLLAWIAALQLCIALSGFTSPWFLHHLDPLIAFAERHTAPSWLQWLTIRYLAGFCLIFPPALCMGATFPLAIGASVKSLAASGRSVGSLSSINTVGGIAGALSAAFLLIPATGIQQSFVIIALLNAAAGLTIIRAGLRHLLRFTAAGIAATAALAVCSLVFIGRNPMILYSRAVHGAVRPVSVVSYQEDGIASVAVLNTGRGRTLTIDGFNAAGTYRYEYMHLLGHLPVLLSPSPDTALVICLGSGTTCGAVSLYPAVKRIDCVEISPAVVDAAREFSDVNYHVTDNVKVRVVCDDGRNHLLRTRRRYDVITLEPMHPYLAAATNLYSSEFYHLCKERLSEHGVMAQWAPMHVLSPPEYRMLIASFVSVFPHTSFWFLGTEGVLIGTMDSLRIDIAALQRKISAAGPAADLARISLTDPGRLLSCFLMDEQNVRSYVRNIPVIRDDLPCLEFSAPRNLIMPVGCLWRDNMEELLRRRVPILSCLITTDSGTRAAIERCQKASSLIMQTGILNARQLFFQAVAAADSALMLMPDDTTAKIAREEAAANAVLVCLNGARVFRSQGLLSQAEQAYLQALTVDSLYAPAHTELATLYNAVGQTQKGLEHAQKAVRSSPGDPAAHTNLAVTYMNFNRHADAEAELLRAVALDASYGRAYHFLAMLYRETGRNEQSLAAMHRSMALGYRPQPR
jgi:spermidine synthase